MKRYLGKALRKETNMLFLLCTAMIISMTVATAVMLHAEFVQAEV